MRQPFVAVVVLFAFSVQTISGQTQSTSSSQTSESEEVRHLKETVSAQADQLAAQQAQIKALQSSFAEQKALLENLLHPNAAPNPPSPAAIPAPAVSATPAPPTVAPVSPVETVSSSALREEQKEQPYVKDPKLWFNKYSLRGYMQVRENNLVNTNPNYKCDQCDKSIGPGNTFFIRRLRLVLSGNVSDYVAVYIQPDFAAASGTSLNFAQLRDAYFDLSVDSEKKNRFRVGQSKIPYGFEELQSSSNRLDLSESNSNLANTLNRPFNTSTAIAPSKTAENQATDRRAACCGCSCSSTTKSDGLDLWNESEG